MWEWVSSPSRSLGVFLTCFCFGILIGPLVTQVSMAVFFWLLIVSLLCAVFFSLRRDRVIALCLFLFIFGTFRYGQSEVPHNIPTVRDHLGSRIHVEGVVAMEPQMSEKTQQVTIGHVRVANQSVFGRMRVSTPKDQSIQVGDRLVFSCSIERPRPFNGFAYDAYLEAKGILALCRFPHDLDRIPAASRTILGTILSFKQSIFDRLQSILPRPHDAFLFGLVFGGDAGIDRETKEEFSRTGTSHILAASGFNVSLFTFVFFAFVIQVLGKKRGAAVTACLLVVYVLMAGATTAVIRAAIFGSVILIASVIGRRASKINTVLLTASLMLLWNPRWLMDDVGFQLSFAAFTAILFFAPKLEKSFLFVPSILGMRESLVGSLSAILFTLPIVLWHFGSLSIVAPFANLFVLPLIPFLMFSTLMIIPISWISIPIAHVLAFPLKLGSMYVLEMISIFASPSFASVSVPFAHALAIVVVVIIITLAFFRRS